MIQSLNDSVLPATVPKNRKTWRELATLAAFCAFLFFFGLSSFGLVGPDEPRYAQVAREMLERDDWVTPTLYGQVWLEKPVLYYWGAQLWYRIFGVSDWAARLPSAVLATALVAAVFFFVRRFRPGAELEASLITASSAAVLGFGRGASTDMPLAAPLAIGMLAWFAWQETEQRRWLAAFYLFLGLAMLAKGPVAPFLAGAIVLAFGAVRRNFKMALRTLWLPGLGIFLAVTAPWFVAVQLRNPEFFRVFIVEHNLARFSTDAFRHAQPLWYYLPVLLLGLMPWTAAVVAVVAESLRDWRSGVRDSLTEFLLVWAVLPVVFFSISQSKLPGYILPAFPPLLLLAGVELGRRLKEGRSAGAVFQMVHAALMGVVTGALLLVPYAVLRPRPAVPSEAKMAAVVMGVVMFAAVFLTLRRYGLPLLRLVTLAPVIVALAYLLRIEGPVLDAALSSRPVAVELERLGGEAAAEGGRA
ncbi:MAG: glycosyltransferase family 39 protein, partial [Acidobacteria bacterium]|nr:glycosyltransferase family 39 protein [Acidobacteriota bacterium]